MPFVDMLFNQLKLDFFFLLQMYSSPTHEKHFLYFRKMFKELIVHDSPVSKILVVTLFSASRGAHLFFFFFFILAFGSGSYIYCCEWVASPLHNQPTCLLPSLGRYPFNSLRSSGANVSKVCPSEQHM